LSGLSSGDHQIKITPHGGAAPGWGNAFGYCGNVSGTLITVGANAVTNRQKLISIDAPLSTLAFAPKTDESLTNADFMFAGVFSGCPSLTDPAVILDNYKLPATVTNLSYFLGGIHLINDALTDPIDLKPLENWLKNNNSIKNLSYFLAGVHMLNNALTDPIVLTPLKDWFIGNESIENLSNFLYSTHYSNPSLNAPIALTSLSGWFIGNESIENLSSFLFDTHYGDNSLNAPINLTPLSGWFNGNGSIKSLSSFLYSTHYNNSSLNAPVDLTPLSSWFSNNRPIDYLSDFLYATHSDNTSLTLSGQRIFPNWIKTMQQSGASILNVSGTFSYTFHLSSGKEKSGDSEPKFQDSTVLSSLGNPSSLKHTYQGRTGITNTAISVNWK
jgi:hypothetical protein